MKKILPLIAFLGLSHTAKCQFSVTQLRVEHMSNPAVVDVPQPRLSWVNVAREGRRGERQTAFQVRVATDPQALRHTDALVWDSGRLSGDESNLVAYQGPALQSGQDYYWQVRTWDSRGRASRWSDVGHWGMGLQPQQWTSPWIESDQDDGGAPLFRKTFTIEKPVRQAKAFICGLGFHELYVNGQRIGEDYLVPNLSNYNPRYDLDEAAIQLDGNFRDYRVLYMAMDVTQQLRRGSNALGVMLGNGFYKPDKHIASVWGHPCLRMQLHITYQDGTTQVIGTDESWLTHPSAIVYSGIYQGETYDARREIPRWAEPGCDESGWTAVRCVPGPQAQMSAMTSPGDRITLSLRPTSVRQTGLRTWEVAWDREVAGWVRLHDLSGRAGDTLQVLFHCESPQGVQRYIFSGRGHEDYQPHFTWFAFSSATITGVDHLSADNLLAEAVNTDVDIDAEFETSDTLLNRINEIWRRSQLDNMHGCVASDCPHRERLPYTGDGQAAAETVMLNFDAAAFYQKWIRDMRDAQNRETGYVPNGAPWQPGCGGGVAWGAAMNIMPWQFYVQYGDLQLLAQSYPAMQDQLRHMLSWVTPQGYMHQRMRNHLSGDSCYWLNLGDWCPPYGLPRDELVHTFYLWLCADYTARAAQALGHEADAAHYRALASEVRRVFHANFYDADNHTYGPYGSNVYALRMGLPDTDRSAVVESLRREIVEEHGGHIITGFLGTKYLLETLSDCGLTDVAYRAMTQTDYPSFGHWIAQGATVTWEQWDGQNSHNHPMFGSGLTWFYRRLAGVEADESQPGYRHFVVRPHLLPDLPEVRYSKQTPYGRLSVDIRQQSPSTAITIQVPVGSTATVHLPSLSVRESGRPLQSSTPGVSSLRTTATETIVTLQQGKYQFMMFN